jgi:hypothetical protein
MTTSLRFASLNSGTSGSTTIFIQSHHTNVSPAALSYATSYAALTVYWQHIHNIYFPRNKFSHWPLLTKLSDNLLSAYSTSRGNSNTVIFHNPLMAKVTRFQVTAWWPNMSVQLGHALSSSLLTNNMTYRYLIILIFFFSCNKIAFRLNFDETIDVENSTLIPIQ